MPLGLFAGRSLTPTRKKSPTFEEERDHLLPTRAGAADAAPTRCSPEDRARSLRGGSISEPSAGFLAKIGAESAFASNSSALERPGDEHTALFHSQMAKVEQKGDSRKFDYRWPKESRKPPRRKTKEFDLKGSRRVTRRCLRIAQQPTHRLDHPHIELAARFAPELL